MEEGNSYVPKSSNSASGYRSDEDNNSWLKRHHRQVAKVADGGGQEAADRHLNNLDDPGLSKEESDLTRQAGGAEFVHLTNVQCERKISNGTTKVEQANVTTGNTVLMDKCLKKESPSEILSWRRNHAKILSYAKIMAGTRPELLVHRNKQVCIRKIVGLCFTCTCRDFKKGA